MRYAVYLTPAEESPLEAAASAWLGRSAFPTRPATAPRAPDAACVAAPARYGFHATMRAPFRLREGVSEADLLAAFHEAYRGTPIAVPLAVTALRHFVALTADASAHVALAAAEARALETFEPFRAPLGPDERARRRPEALDPRERELLDAWGYPYVLERFVFHMTLSGPVEAAVAPVVAAAKTHFAALLTRPIPLVHAIYREAVAGGPFTVLSIETREGAAHPERAVPTPDNA